MTDVLSERQFGKCPEAQVGEHRPGGQSCGTTAFDPKGLSA